MLIRPARVHQLLPELGLSILGDTTVRHHLPLPRAPMKTTVSQKRQKNPASWRRRTSSALTKKMRIILLFYQPRTILLICSPFRTLLLGLCLCKTRNRDRDRRRVRGRRSPIDPSRLISFDPTTNHYLSSITAPRHIFLHLSGPPLVLITNCFHITSCNSDIHGAQCTPSGIKQRSYLIYPRTRIRGLRDVTPTTDPR